MDSRARRSVRSPALFLVAGAMTFTAANSNPAARTAFIDAAADATRFLRPDQTTPDTNHVALRVRAYADKRVDQALLVTTREDTQRLMASAGISAEWRLCRAAADCPVDGGPVPEVVVILTSSDRPGRRENCGLAALGKADARGTVMVWVPCLERGAHRIRNDLANRLNPSLAMLTAAHIGGAVVAHELGHILGLRHSQTGIMRATIVTEDVIALRRGTLRFSAQESARMRVSASEWVARHARRVSGEP